ncbi:MAG: hypothetical protein ACLQEQ_08890 [Nitrososphaerales archaeon]
MSSPSKKRHWYSTFRMAAYASVFGALTWTVLMVLPFSPFSELPPIMVGGGPGQWLVVAYLLYVSLGGGAFGWLSGLLHVIEKGEDRDVSPSLMWPGFVMLFFGVTVSCVSLGYAGASGGYASINGGSSSLHQMLSPYVYPITATAVVAVAGAVLVLLAMIRARGP